MKRISTIAMALMMGMVMLVSCNKEKESNNEVVFHASIESRTQDRTYLEPDGNQGYVKWMAGDQIRIYNGNGENAVFTLKSGANTTNGTFAYAGEFDMVPPYLAVYPSTAMMNDADDVIFEVPAVQNLTEPGTFANGANPMLAFDTDEDLDFQNLCGGLGIRLYGNAHVSSITILGYPREKLNGQFAVFDEGLETSPCDGDNLVTLTCDVTLSPTDTTNFYVVLPVGVLHYGVIVDIYDGETMIGEIPLPEGNAAQVERNTIKSFRPVEITMPEGHEYVDLGLPSGLLWATCNVGAETPEDYGDYFAWGETTPKDTYDWPTYQHYNGSDLTKYTGSDGLTTLESSDDAATANWGNGWRMPTKAEFEELYNNTTNVWTTQDGVDGRLFTAANGNSLFLPAAGYRYGSSLSGVGSYGFFWSSSFYTGSPYFAWYFDFDSGSNLNISRSFGQSVRAVRSAE